jgi:hypothetical protein
MEQPRIAHKLRISSNKQHHYFDILIQGDAPLNPPTHPNLRNHRKVKTDPGMITGYNTQKARALIIPDSLQYSGQTVLDQVTFPD